MRQLHIDLETFSDVDLRKSGLYNYVQSPFFQIMLFAYGWDDDPVNIVDLVSGEVLPSDIVEALVDPQVTKHAHNAAFEIACLSKFYYTPCEQWECSMIHSYYCRMPGSLGPLTSALGFKQDKAKDRAGSQLIKLFCVPTKPTKKNGYRTRTLPRHEPEKWQLFKDYCVQDVVAERAVEKALEAYPVPQEEWTLWQVDQQINRHGVKLDLQLVNAAIEIDTEYKDRLTEEATQLSGLDNPNSVSQLKTWLGSETGEEITSLNKADVKQMIHETSDDTVQRVLEIRQELGKTSVTKYQAMSDVVGSDGRARGLLQFYGSGTGRWAGRLIQVQNLPRNHIEMLGLARTFTKAKRPDALQLIWGSVSDTLSQLVRTAFIPETGHRFIVSDFSAIEARVIAWLAKEQWRQDVFATTGKIYEASASQMFGVPVDLIVKGNPEYDLRQKGKVAELALGYQGSTGALIQMGALNMGLTEEELPDIVQRWRRSSPRIVDLWYAMDTCAVECVRTCQPQTSHGIVFRMETGGAGPFLSIELPSGRKLFFCNPELGKNQWDGDQVFYHASNQTSRKWEKTSIYGGKIVENIVQAIARDCLAVSMQRLAFYGYQTVMHVHDEVILEVPNGKGSLQEVTEIMGQPISWAPGLLLKSAGFEAEYYQKD